MQLNSFLQIISDLKNKPLSSIYWLYGEEIYVIDEILNILTQRSLAQSTKDFNYDSFYGSSTKVDDIQLSAQTFPMMSEKRVLVIKEAQQFTEKELVQLIALFENLPPTTLLIFISDKIDKRKKIFKEVAKKGLLIEASTPYENQLKPWIQYFLKIFKISLSKEASDLLSQTLNFSITEISNEIKKISEFTQNKPHLEIQDLLEIIPKKKMEDVFELTKAIGQKECYRALGYLNQLLDQGQSGVGIVMLIRRHLKILMDIKECLESGKNQQFLSTQTGVPPFFLNSYIDQTKLWSHKKLKDSYQLLLMTDKNLKSSPLKSSIWLENFIIRLS